VIDAYRASTNSAHAAVALRAAQESIVLLRTITTNSPFPLAHVDCRHRGRRLVGPRDFGSGQFYVNAPFVTTPLTAIRHAVSTHVKVTYSAGGPNAVPLGRLDDSGAVFLKPLPIRAGSGLTSQLANDDLSIEAAANVTNTVNTASEPSTGRGWSHWSAVFRAKATGEYEVAVRQVGDTWSR